MNAIRLGLAGAALALLLGAGAAQAGDASCLWRALPQPTRDAFLAAYDTKGADALSDMAADNATMNAAGAACHVDDAHGVAAGEALGAYALKLASARVLKNRYGIDEPKLQAAWAGLGSERQTRFSLSVADMYAGKTTDAVDRATPLEIAAKVGAADDDSRTQVTLYLFAIVLLADREKLF